MYVCVRVCVCTLKMMLLCVQVSLELASSPTLREGGEDGGTRLLLNRFHLPMIFFFGTTTFSKNICAVSEE